MFQNLERKITQFNINKKILINVLKMTWFSINAYTQEVKKKKHKFFILIWTSKIWRKITSYSSDFNLEHIEHGRFKLQTLYCRRYQLIIQTWYCDKTRKFKKKQWHNWVLHGVFWESYIKISAYLSMNFKNESFI